MIVSATNAQENSREATEWLRAQPDVIRDGKCGCVMRLQRCQERQAIQPHQQCRIINHQSHELETRDVFVMCSGSEETDPCKYYNRPEHQKVAPRKRNTFNRREFRTADQLAQANKARSFTEKTELGKMDWRLGRVAARWKMKAGVKV